MFEFDEYSEIRRKVMGTALLLGGCSGDYEWPPSASSRLRAAQSLTEDEHRYWTAQADPPRGKCTTAFVGHTCLLEVRVLGELESWHHLWREDLPFDDSRLPVYCQCGLTTWPTSYRMISTTFACAYTTAMICHYRVSDIQPVTKSRSVP